ncbi:hypothetical protein UA08_08928 [Talaromyces atroroseus]|uniref:BZIP domain-containing protein n=1 Tax=Talaromyces atroroseus TaxID=1441469 RepID=A0A225A7N3_TALAT|nr:hypothetical protein UA08_08928 [Talaromyces atroroseus]OKL55830.1 hypothetical protein UA08_08928 [Talaromyces atroroseus]
MIVPRNISSSLLLSLLLVVDYAASSITLSQFEEIQGFSSSCESVWQEAIPGCTKKDFANDDDNNNDNNTCSRSCLAGVNIINAEVLVACSDARVDSSTLLGQFLSGYGVFALCGGGETGGSETMGSSTATASMIVESSSGPESIATGFISSIYSSTGETTTTSAMQSSTSTQSAQPSSLSMTAASVTSTSDPNLTSTSSGLSTSSASSTTMTATTTATTSGTSSASSSSDPEAKGFGGVGNAFDILGGEGGAAQLEGVSLGVPVTQYIWAMEANADDLVERRRLQNRLAQRKFREKKRRGTENRLVNNTEQSSAVARGEINISTSPPLEDPINHFAETIFGSHTTDQLLCQETQDITFSSQNIPALQSHLAPPTLEEVTTWDLGLWNALSSTGNVNISQPDGGPVQTQIQHTPSQPRSSDPDIPPSTQPDPNDKSMSRLISTANNEKGWISSLHIAAQTGHEQIVRVLLLSGNIDVNQQDSDDRTPLIHAVMENHESVVCLLLEHGAQIGILDCDGRSGIHWAILRRNLTILQLLLKHRSENEQALDIDAYDITGWTPLHMAIIRSFEPAVLLLIQLGADITAKAHKCPFQEKRAGRGLQ